MFPNAFLPGVSSLEELLSLEGLDSRKNTLVYISGSLVEQLGNSGSDVDLYVIGTEVPSAGELIYKEDHVISIHWVDNRRVDFEFWSLDSVERIAAKLAALPVGREFIADQLGVESVVFIHRLKCGVALQAEDCFARISQLFDFGKFQAYLIQEAIHRSDGAIEDVLGMMDDGDRCSTVMRCRDLVGLAADIYRYSHGSTNPVVKWRAKALTLLPKSQATDEIIDQFWILNFPDGARLMADDSALKGYAERCLRFSEGIIARVQR